MYSIKNIIPGSRLEPYWSSGCPQVTAVIERPHRPGRMNVPHGRTEIERESINIQIILLAISREQENEIHVPVYFLKYQYKR